MSEIHGVKTVYRIQRIWDGRYSTGGWEPVFKHSKFKEWASLGTLRNHLSRLQSWANQVGEDQPARAEKLRNSYQGCRVVTITYVETVTHQPLLDNLLKR